MHDDQTGAAPEPAPDYPALIAAGERAAEQIVALREDVKAAEARTAARVEAAKKMAAANLDKEKVARRRSQRRTWATVLLDVALSLISLVLWHAQTNTNSKLQESLRQNYITQEQQTATRVRVLCPLYTVLLTSAASSSQRPGLTGEQQKQLAASIQVVRDGYKTLGCEPPPVTPPATTHT